MCFSQKQSGIFAKKSDTYKYNKSFLYEAIPFFIIKIKFNHPFKLIFCYQSHKHVYR